MWKRVRRKLQNVQWRCHELDGGLRERHLGTDASANKGTQERKPLLQEEATVR